MNKNKYILLFLVFSVFSVFSQENYWTPLNEENARETSDQKRFYLNSKAFNLVLSKEVEGRKYKKPSIIYLPDFKGDVEKYYVIPSEILSDKLQHEYPTIKSFSGFSVNDTTKKVSFVWSDDGLNAVIFHGEKRQYIQPDTDNSEKYSVYKRKPTNKKSSFKCKTSLSEGVSNRNRQVSKRNYIIDDATIRTVRIAVATTYEYGLPWYDTSDTDKKKKSKILAEVVATINHVNLVYKPDLGVQLQLVEVLLYTTPENPFKKVNFNRWSGAELQKLLDDEVGDANYDVGHLFHGIDLGGNAVYIGSAGISGIKGRGFSSANFHNKRYTDYFAIDVLAHEIGHQLGAYHTFSYVREGTNFQVEPGSGTTIMGYAGTTNNDDVQDYTDPYFHSISIHSIREKMKEVNYGTMQQNINGKPVIDPIHKEVYYIPRNTAYYLERKASDPDGDKLYYSWEESDVGIVSANTFGPNNKKGAMARAKLPTKESFRYIPNLKRITEGKLLEINPKSGSDWETVSSVARDLDWTFVVRDRAVLSGEYGRLNVEKVKVKVIEDSEPFKVLSHTEKSIWTIGKPVTIRWDVAQTNIPPIDSQKVNVYFSVDGGLSYPYQLVSNLPNTGEATIQIDNNNLKTEEGRFMIRAADNIFLAVNQANITVKQPEDTDKDGILDDKDNCQFTPNPNQSDIDGDGIGDVCDDDMDGDGILNDRDNCPRIANPDQEDFDKDGIGDVCDDDMDGDGIPNTEDDKQDLILIKNFFSPNGDTKNDVWKIVRLDDYRENEVTVFDNNGEEVFHEKGYKNNWKGLDKSGTQLPAGTYFYLIKFKHENHEEELKGWLYINF